MPCRDLKPCNCVVTCTGDVRLVDFGLTRKQEAVGHSTWWRGTHFYAPAVFDHLDYEDSSLASHFAATKDDKLRAAILRVLAAPHALDLFSVGCLTLSLFWKAPKVRLGSSSNIPGWVCDDMRDFLVLCTSLSASVTATTLLAHPFLDL